MKTKFSKMFKTMLIVPSVHEASSANNSLSYLLGGIIALLILGYLIYTLLRPDKF
jgi:K+-transporting ATPase KdpF subunit